MTPEEGRLVKSFREKYTEALEANRELQVSITKLLEEKELLEAKYQASREFIKLVL